MARYTQGGRIIWKSELQIITAGKAPNTRGRESRSLVYYETFEAKEEAMKREYAIKHMSRKEKEKLIEHFPIL